MNKANRPDFVLLVISAVLILLGVLMISSISATFSYEKFGNTQYVLLHQIIYGILPGIFLGFVAFKINILWFKKWSFVLLLLNLILMGLIFIPGLGLSFGGATRWLNLGFSSLQPSEFLKITFILYLAAWLSARLEKSSHKKNKESWKFTLIPFLVVLGIVGLLLFLQSDISTLGIIIANAFIIYFLAKTPFWHSVLIILIGLAVLASFIFISHYRWQRLTVFLSPFLSPEKADPLGSGYQINQSLIAVGSGGIFGQGIGMSRQKFGFLPHSMTDSVFAIFAEEAGFLGSLILMFLFLGFLWRGFKVSKESTNVFCKLAAAGITSWIVIQSFINIGAIIGILPLAGIPLPFISYGGSALLTELIGLGILLNISKNVS